jgi:DNA/RNA endonuclease YhcR with UshA esterase domain
MIVSYVWMFYWNKPQQNIKNAKAISITATELFNEYSTAERTTNDKYIDKIIEVTGEVLSTSKNNEGKQVILLKTDDPMFGINCTMEEEATVKEGEAVTIKGICTGYLTDVVIIRCIKVD